jgi:hypothetical protein
MKKKYLSMVAIGFMVTVLSCQTDDSLVSADEISADVISKISALGFSTDNVQMVDGAYLVEGDIMLRPSDLNRAPESKLLRIAEVEQYHTFNLVTATPRTVTVSASGSLSQPVSDAIDAALKRYNSEHLQVKFQRVATGGEINIRIINGGPYIASAGFPSGGDPYPEVKFNRQYQNFSAGFLTTVMAHELGHCIGFRHTDYMDRSFSCGTGGNEGQETTGIGAVHISGTPTGPDAASWMLACLSRTTDRPFNANDKTALRYLY